MKHRIMLSTVMVLALAAGACNGWILGLEGSGVAARETRPITDFDSVVLEGPGTVMIDIGPAPSLTIEADDNLLQHLTSEIEGGTLVLGTDRQLDPTLPIVFTIGVPSLTALEIAGSGSISTSGIDSDSFKLSISGSGNIDVSDVDASAVNASVSGSGNIRLDGDSGALSVSISGSGNFLGSELAAATVDASVSGSGNAIVNASDSLEGTIAGSGSIQYVGDPLIDVSVTGSGRVTRR